MKKSLSQRIKAIREKAGISPTELATKAKLSPAFISKLEKGDYDTLSLTTSKQLADGFGLTLKSFLEKIDILKENNNRPSFLVASQALRESGLTEAQVKEVMNYANFIKHKLNHDTTK